MRYKTAINNVVKYIEDNLEEKLELKSLAKIANISPYHFHRIFLKETGEKLNDYIIKRRLTEASIDLLETKDLVIDISLKYGFNSPDSFSRSFKKLYEVSPREYRKNSILNIDLVKTRVKHEGNKESKYKILQKMELLLTGYEIKPNDLENTSNDINSLFQKVYNDLQDKMLIPKENCMYMVYNDGIFFLGVRIKPLAKLSKNMVTRSIQSKKYIAFYHKGCVDKIGQTLDKIYNKWLPAIAEVEVDHSFVLQAYDEKHHPSFFTPQNKPYYSFDSIRDSTGIKDSFYFDIFFPIKE